MFFFLNLNSATAAEVGKSAPVFQTQTHEGKPFDLVERKGKWTVLYFYPKADTPGCTKQACAYRDSIKVVRDEGAEVYGISADPVSDIAKFHQKYHLNFPLLADPDAKIVRMYDVKMPLLSMSKRWTFIIDPELVVRSVDIDVDPVLDAKKTAEKLHQLKTK